MRGFKDDEYDDYDDYEEERYEQDEGGDEDDEYEQEEEERKPTKEEAEYLELRAKLKENFRRKKGASGSQEIKKDNFGSFFGPSKPVIAPRVIQESKSFLENQHLSARVLKPQQNANKSSSSRPSGSKPGVRPQPPRVSEQKKRVQKIKDTRDYSFLLSEDADLPAPPKQPPSRSVPAPSSDARAAKFSSQSSRQTPASNVRHVNDRDEKKPTSANLHSNSRSVSASGHSNTRPVSTSGHSNPRPVSANGHSNPRPVSANGHSNPRPVSANGHSNPRPVSANGHSNPRPGSTNGHSNPRPGSTNGHSNPRTGSINGHGNPRTGSANGHSNHRVGHGNGHSNTGAGPSRLSSDSKPQMAPNRKQVGSNNGCGPGRPAVSNGSAPKKPIRPPQKFSSQCLKSSVPAGTKPSSMVKMQSASRYQLEPRRDIREPDRGRVPSKHAVASNRPQVQGLMNKPQKQMTSHNRQQDQRPKKRPSRPFPEDDDDDDAVAFSMLRKMLRYDPNKFAGRDEDDSDMEANFDDILREENRSARIARQEDEEQLRLIEEEERRERMRKMKKRKMG